jgi:16S rRNA (guanine966-N2)-methyltransferase
VFPDRSGLRPTPDRVRETLFNWLAASLAGSRVLDVCAGSGVLGLEALSRGAREAVLLETDRQAVEALYSSVDDLAANAKVHNIDARAYLGSKGETEIGFDVVFVDPPYDSGLQPTLCGSLATQGWLRPGAHVYVESREGLQAFEPPGDWNLLREKRAGQVEYRLFGTV